MPDRLFDTIHYWSEVKIQILTEYASAYGKILRAHRLDISYIDGFAGPGVSLSKVTGQMVDGSPIAALRVIPPFHEYHFVERKRARAEELRRRAERTCHELGLEPARVHVHEGDANEVLQRMLQGIEYRRYRRALCLLDPYGLDLDWSVVELAGHMKTIDLVLNFPIMDINRTAIWTQPDRVQQWALDRMTAFWGDESWRQAAYRPSPQMRLTEGEELTRRANEDIVEVFRTRLKDVALFQCVPRPIAMRNRKNAVVYYLFFASQQPVAAKIASSIFGKWDGYLASS